MSRIDELRKNAVNPDKPITLNQLTNEDVAGPDTTGFVPTLTVLDEPVTPTAPRTVSMTSGKTTTRTKADLSTLPNKTVTGNNKDFATEVKESIVNDILGEGGEFSAYIKQKTEEFKEWQEVKEIEESEKKAQLERETGVVQEDDEDDVDSDSIGVTQTYKEIDILGDIMEETEMVTEELDVAVDMEPIVESDPFEEIDETENGPVFEEEVEEDYFEENIAPEEEFVEEISNDDIVVEIGHVTEPIEVDDDGDYNVSEDDLAVDEISDADRLQAIRNLICEKIHPTAKKLDLTSFTIAKKVNTDNSVFVAKEAPVAKWVLPNSENVVSMKEYTGVELEKVRAAMEQNNPDTRTILQSMYDHIVSPKPETFSKWIRTANFFDFDHLFFAIYIASFAGANYIPVDCANDACPNKIKTYLTNDIPVMDMVKFKDEAAKAKFQRIYKSESYNPKALKLSEIVPITDTLAIGFTVPSLYSALIEPDYFDTAFRNKYESTINLLPYIDQMYTIDAANATLIPVGYKIFDNNASKTVKSRVKRYNTILKSLRSDEYTMIGGFVNRITDTRNDVLWTYQYPETTCPHCGHTNPALENQNASQMVFTRNRLGLLAIS